MKTIKVIFLISCSLLAFGIAQAASLNKSGGATAFGKTFDTVDVSGGVKLTDVIVKQYIRVSGGARLTNVKANSVKVSGGLTFDELEVAGTVDVAGSIRNSINLKCKNLDVSGGVQAQNIECNTMDISGGVKLENVKVSGGASISGNVDIKTGQFDNLNLAAKSMSLEDVNVNNIVVEEGGGIVIINNVVVRGSGEQVLHLKGSTTVSGNVTFKSGKGTIIIDSGANVNGTVTGLKSEESEEESEL